MLHVDKIDKNADPEARKVGYMSVLYYFPILFSRSASQLSWTRDPFDRVITAQSAIDRNRLITKDKIIRDHYEHAVW